MGDGEDGSRVQAIGRRGFMSAVARWGIEQAEQLTKAAVSITADSDGGGSTDLRATRYLRPPGALDEPAFGETCSRCAACVQACPAQCIQLDTTPPPSPPPADPGASQPRAAEAGGLPYIVARRSPCVVCDELSCMTACPTGALQLVDRTQIQMGIAVVDHATCLRSSPKPEPTETADDPRAIPETGAAEGQDCRLCIQDCPLGEAAIGLSDDSRIQVRDGCTGCGVCERVCPTEPPSIVVQPAREDHRD